MSLYMTSLIDVNSSRAGTYNENQLAVYPQIPTLPGVDTWVSGLLSFDVVSDTDLNVRDAFSELFTETGSAVTYTGDVGPLQFRAAGKSLHLLYPLSANQVAALNEYQAHGDKFITQVGWKSPFELLIGLNHAGAAPPTPNGTIQAWSNMLMTLQSVTTYLPGVFGDSVLKRVLVPVITG